METKTTTIRGLAVDVIVIETIHLDAGGSHLWYTADVYIRERKNGTQHLARRTRVPGAGQALARDVQRMGVRALDVLAR